MLKTLIEKRLSNSKSIKVISFDVFDTLLLRIMPSARVTELSVKHLCRKWNESHSRKLEFEEVLASRDQFRLSNESRFIFNERQWTVSQWLDCLAEKYRLDSEAFKQVGRRAELTAERLSVRPAKNAGRVVSSIKDKGIICLAISDTWIDRAWLVELLEEFGLRFDELFASGDVCMSKRRGTLFRFIQERYQLTPKAFLHVGDNFQSDFVAPRLMGWSALWLPKQERSFSERLPATLRRRLRPRLHREEILRALNITPAPNTFDPYYRIAFDHLAPLLIIFSIVQWRRFRGQNIKVVFYLARDAYLMLKAFELVSDLFKDDFPRHYLRLSRRSVALAHPANFLQSAIPLAGKVGRKTVGAWLGNFALDESLAHEILNRAGLHESSPFGFHSRERIRSACNSLRNEIERLQSVQRKLIYDYLSQVAGNNKLLTRVGLVDSGWACTTQDALRAVLTEAEVVSGMYLGVSAQGTPPTPVNTKYGLLRDDFRNMTAQNAIEASAGVVRLWDTLLREPVDTVDCLMRKSDGTVYPVLRKIEVLRREEILASDSLVAGLQDGCLRRSQGVRLIMEFIEAYADVEFEHAATKLSSRISTHPDRQLAGPLLKLGFDEGTERNLQSNLGLRGFFKGTAWYPGLLANYGLGFLMPIMRHCARALRMKRKSEQQ